MIRCGWRAGKIPGWATGECNPSRSGAGFMGPGGEVSSLLRPFSRDLAASRCRPSLHGPGRRAPWRWASPRSVAQVRVPGWRLGGRAVRRESAGAGCRRSSSWLPFKRRRGGPRPPGLAGKTSLKSAGPAGLPARAHRQVCPSLEPRARRTLRRRGGRRALVPPAPPVLGPLGVAPFRLSRSSRRPAESVVLNRRAGVMSGQSTGQTTGQIAGQPKGPQPLRGKWPVKRPFEPLPK